jgi:hypothetical protein
MTMHYAIGYQCFNPACKAGALSGKAIKVLYSYSSKFDIVARMFAQWFVTHPPLNLPLEGGEAQ